jgi:glycine/D-amino acid oxidase-like deaminating enzyme
MTVAERNFWLTTAEAPVLLVRPLPERVDVAVIGAGFTGLSAARTLARGGARVAVLEAENVGWGASCRNGGMVLSGLKLGTQLLLKRYGREATKRMYAASLESIDCVEEIVREEGIACDFSRCGHLEVACKAKHFEEFRRGAETIEREFGHRLRIVEKKDLPSEIGSAIYHGGMIDEGMRCSGSRSGDS